MMFTMKKKADLSALNHLPHNDTYSYEIRRQEDTGMIQLNGVSKPKSSKSTLFRRIFGRKVG